VTVTPLLRTLETKHAAPRIVSKRRTKNGNNCQESGNGLTWSVKMLPSDFIVVFM